VFVWSYRKLSCPQNDRNKPQTLNPFHAHWEHHLGEGCVL